MRYVLDCSVAVKWFVPEHDSDKARALLGQWLSGQMSFVAPDVIVSELGHALRKHVVGKGIAAQDSFAAMDEFLHFPLALVPATLLASHAIRLTAGHMSTFYDALYVSLAVKEDVKIVTADGGMASAFAPLNRTIALSTFAT